MIFLETRQITIGILIIAALFIICRKMVLNYDVNFDGQMLGVMVHPGRQRLKRKVNSREILAQKRRIWQENCTICGTLCHVPQFGQKRAVML